MLVGEFNFSLHECNVTYALSEARILPPVLTLYI